jgi:sugar phosphate isomerase/epimerase
MEFNYGQEPTSYTKYGTEGPNNDTSDLGVVGESNIEQPIVAPNELGQSVTEGSRFGTFVQTVQAAIKHGASSIELQTGMAGGQEAVGAESYGQEARQALREIAKANEVKLTSVHAPTQIGNVSGFNPQQGFSDDQRKMAVNEINKAIDFASEVTGGGTITFHTGEFQRPMSEQEWAKLRDEKGNIITDENGNEKYMFLTNIEEPGRAQTYMVDNRTGRIISDVRKSNVIREPEYKRAESDKWGEDIEGNKVLIKRGDLLSVDDKYIDPTNVDHLFKRVAIWDDDMKNFKTRQLAWKDIEKRKDEFNSLHKDREPLTTEEMAYRIQVENQIMQARGSSLYHGRSYQEELKSYNELKKLYDHYKKLEENMPEDELWKIMQADPKIKAYHARSQLTEGIKDMKKPTEILKESLEQTEHQLTYVHQASASADAQADTLKDTLEHVRSVSKYAKDQSFRSLGELGISALHKTIEGKKKGLVNRDITLTPENIFPEMGYGSHPDELIEMVKQGRKEMVKLLTTKEIEDPHRRIKLVKDPETGLIKEEFEKIKNPWYDASMNEKKAEEFAKRHIKANLDTQHLGMWGKYFQPTYNDKEKRMETPEETKERFRAWYMEQVKKLAEEDVLGETHIVDGYMSGGHTHLPVGQGELPVVDAVTYLKKKGFKGVMISEGHGEEQWSPGRIMHKAWEAFGTPVFRSGYFGSGGGNFASPISFTDVHNSYFANKGGTYHVLGGYSPSNDWTMWSEMPLE